MKSVGEELKAIEKYLAYVPEIRVEQIYENMHGGRQQLFTPIEEPIQQYIKNWEGITYQGKSFDAGAAKLYTEKGESVRVSDQNRR